MSFDPLRVWTSSQRGESPPQQKPSLLRRGVNGWMTLVIETHLMRKLPCKNYCEKAWTKQQGTDPSHATELFLQTCMKSCRDCKEYKGGPD